MAKREKTRSSLGTLNSLNEEEEHGKVNPLEDSFMNSINNTTINLEDAEKQSQQNEQHKLRLAIGKLSKYEI
jgi:hypothetical protein